VVRAVLAGEHGPVRDIVLLNAAAALAVAAGVPGPDAVTSALADGYARAAKPWIPAPPAPCSTAGYR
jgi:anthranilate phosphoribosyltransferase